MSADGDWARTRKWVSERLADLKIRKVLTKQHRAAAFIILDDARAARDARVWGRQVWDVDEALVAAAERFLFG